MTEHWQDPPLAVVSSLLRSMLIASPGHRLVAGDFSQVEARVLGWLAGEPFGDLEYERMAAAIYRVPLADVTPEQRQVGKFIVLGCGFQMGADRFATQFQEQTGVVLDRGKRDEEGNLLPGEVDEADHAVRTYRETKAGIPDFWYGLQRAAMDATRNPGMVMHCGALGNIRYVVRGQFLWCVLPSGRPLAYALPRIEDRETSWGEMRPTLTYMGMDTYTRKWQRLSTYGGHLTENVVQATARDLMAEAMLRLEDAGYPVVLTVHDEVVADVPNGHGSLDEFLTIMRKSPTWADGLTLEVEGWEGERYRK